ncbi:hypothetical protein BJ322DRAFT_723306 [Thelephora terrestris]|uniref:Uncharacterized protein n=1 Tax=Thelephora terrestris TaxID=56493 RepID=A0A9P6HKY5_9AGAM|nr:hypothetical protein BJ322DRAFT_723306 [Thelephora terrestris]
MPRPKNQEGLQQLPWASNNNAAVWRLVSALEEPENRRKLFGKSPSENTSGDSKTKVYGRIAEFVWPEVYKDNQKAVTSRTKSKAEWLQKTYAKYLARLRRTGEGVSRVNEGGAVHNDCPISADGPDETTPEYAMNLWEEIHQEFPWFGALHRILSSRPNIVPPAIVTGVGPAGREITFNNPPPPSQSHDPDIDPALYTLGHSDPPRMPASA